MREAGVGKTEKGLLVLQYLKTQVGEGPLKGIFTWQPGILLYIQYQGKFRAGCSCFGFCLKNTSPHSPDRVLLCEPPAGS